MDLLKRSLFVMSCSMVTGFSQSAVASEGTASLDWSQLQVSVTGVGGSTPTVTLTDQITNLSSSASIPGQTPVNDSVSLPDWTSTGDTHAQTGDSFSNALASPQSLSGNVQATRELVDPDDAHHPVEALSLGSRTANFSLDGPSTLTVSVPYMIGIAGGQPFNFFDAISATVSGNSSFNGSVNDPVLFSLSSFEDASPRTQSGNLVFDIVAGGAGTGTLEPGFTLSSQAPVIPIPEPESYAMLLAGLSLIGAITRRRTT
jgi:PEP-CTERM motif